MIALDGRVICRCGDHDVLPISAVQGAEPAACFGGRAGECCGPVAKRFLDWCALRGDHDEFVDSVLVQDRGVGTDPTTEDDDRNVVAACELRDTERCLALHGLGIDTAFSGEHPISTRDGVFQTNRFGDDLHSGLGFCAQKLEQREPQPACGAGARTSWVCMTECRGSHTCQMRQCRFQSCDVGGAAPF